jgi:DNA primase
MTLDQYLTKFKNDLYDGPDSIDALNYLNGRKISTFTQVNFELGYANEYIKDLGNFYKSIIIPSINMHGEIKGLFGRRLYDIEPKHIISTGYDKKSNILGLSQAYKFILELRYAIITEGVFDILMMHECGFVNTVGAPGKDWSDRQIALLRRFTDTVILLFDNDLVGKEATEKYLKKFYAAGFFVIEGRFPNKFKDVDQFLKTDTKEGILYLNNIISRRNNINE